MVQHALNDLKVFMLQKNVINLCSETYKIVRVSLFTL